MEGKNPSVDEVPESSSEWRKDCQKMFVEANKVTYLSSVIS